MPASSIFACITALSCLSFFGGVSFKQFALTQNVLWLVSGFCTYGLSNVLLIVIISEQGLARSMVFASAAQIILTTVAGVAFRENLTFWQFVAAGLCCAAISLGIFGDGAAADGTTSKLPTIHQKDQNG